MQKLNPDDFVISRKRKKYRFAKFHNAENCFELDEWDKREIDTIELGAGTGFFALELARRHPDKMIAAVDVKADRLQQGAYVALSEGITNIVFIRARADQLGQLCPQGSLSSLWLTFPDPFPRARSARRRMTHPLYLAQYKELLKPSGSLYLKHDNVDFFTWSLEQFVAEKWSITELSFNLHESELNDAYKFYTSYEERWLNEGRITHFVHTTRV